MITSPLKYLCRSIDGSDLARRGPFKLVVPRLTSEILSVDNICTSLPGLCGKQGLMPDYDHTSLTWLLSMLDQKAAGQPIRKVLLRDDKQVIVGWYMYCLTIGGAWKVLQLVAARHAFNDVLDHLFYQAREDGVIAISGYMDPGFFQPLAAKDCLFRHDGSTAWMLFHSREQEINDAFFQQKAFVSRLDAEWWIGYLLE